MPTVRAPRIERPPTLVEVRDDDAIWGDLRPELLEAVRPILETTVEDELAAELNGQPREGTARRLVVPLESRRRTLA